MDFPNGQILIQEKFDATGGVSRQLPDGYRRLDTNENMKYFFSRMVTKIHPSGHKFDHDKGKKKISEMFLVSDEAFALLIIYNEIERWNYFVKKEKEEMMGEVDVRQQSGNKRKRDPDEPRKKFNNASSGDKEGWSQEGRALYQKLCRGITALRSDPITGAGTETTLMAQFEEREADTRNHSFSNPTDNGESVRQELSGFVPDGWQNYLFKPDEKMVIANM